MEIAMKVKVEFLRTHTSDVYDIGRIPCVGEHVYDLVASDDTLYEVVTVMHAMNADPETQVAAIIRVKEYLRLDQLPAGVTADTAGFLATVTLEIGKRA
jgi:hypothetical protein